MYSSVAGGDNDDTIYDSQSEGVYINTNAMYSETNVLSTNCAIWNV